MTNNTIKILIVEDDEFLRELYTELVQKEGYTVEGVQDGVTALERLQAGGYDLVVLDVMLPRMDGLAILKKLREQPPRQPNKTIVLLTNVGEDQTINEAMQYGAAAYLLKSQLNPDEVLGKIKEFLGEQQPAS